MKSETKKYLKDLAKHQCLVSTLGVLITAFLYVVFPALRDNASVGFALSLLPIGAFLRVLAPALVSMREGLSFREGVELDVLMNVPWSESTTQQRKRIDELLR